MKKVTLLSLVFFGVILSACGKAPVLEVDPELQPYVAQFEEQSVQVGAPVRVTDLIAQFGDLPNPRTNGVCEVQEGETPRIIISRIKWDRMSPEKRESLMFHELGHCVLGRTHKSDTNTDGIPASLMNPYSLDSATYAEYRSYYLAELFGRSSS